MATTIGEAFISIRGKTDKFASDTKSGVEKSAGALGSSAGKIFASAFGAASVGIFLKNSIAEGQEARKVAALTQAVIKSTGGAAKVSGDQVAKYADKLSLIAGVDDELIAKGENVLLRFTNIRNEVGAGNNIFERAIALSVDYAAATGTDAAGAANTLGKALNNPLRGLTLLGRAGIVFTDQQKEAIKADVARGDILSAQKILLDKLSGSFDGAAASQATAQAKLSVVWKNIEEEVGLALLPVLDNLANGLSVLLPKAIDDAKKAFSTADKITEPLQQAAQHVFDSWFDPSKGALGKSNFDRGLDVLKERFNRFLLGNTTQNASLAAQTAQAFGIKETPPPAAGEGGLLGIKIADAQHDATVLRLADANASTFEKIVAKTENIISDAFGLDIEAHASQQAADFAAGLDILGQRLSTGWARIHDDAVSFWNTWGDDITTIVSGVFGVLSGIVETFSAAIIGAFRIIGDVIGLDWDQAWTDIKDTVHGTLDGVVDFISGVVTIIKGILGTVWQGIGGGIAGVLNGIISGFESALNVAVGLVNVALDALDKAAGPFVNFGEIGKVQLPRIPVGGGSTSTLTPIRGAFAFGGTTPGPGFFLVGERGPEVVGLPGGARVTPNGGELGIGELHVHVSPARTNAMTPLQEGDLIGRAIGAVLPSVVG